MKEFKIIAEKGFFREFIKKFNERIGTNEIYHRIGYTLSIRKHDYETTIVFKPKIDDTITVEDFKTITNIMVGLE